MSQITKPPTFMRYLRVENILVSQLAFRDRLSKKTESVLKPNGTSQLFAPEVVKTTQLIHEGGKDAHTCPKVEVIKAAMDVFAAMEKATSEAALPVAAAPEPQVVTPEPEPPVAQPAPPAPEPPAPEPPVQEAQTITETVTIPNETVPVQAATPTTPETKPEPAKRRRAKPQAPETPNAEQSQDRDEAVDQAKNTLMSNRPAEENTGVHNAYISMFTLVLTTIQLCEMFDNQPGKVDRLKSLEELAKAFNTYTSVK